MDSRQDYSRALDLFGEGKLDQAGRAMEEILKRDPDFLDTYEGLAVIYSRLNRLDDAIDLMKRLAEKDPDNIMAHTNLSVFYMRKGMKEIAEEEKAKATVLQFSKKSREKS